MRELVSTGQDARLYGRRDARRYVADPRCVSVPAATSFHMRSSAGLMHPFLIFVYRFLCALRVSAVSFFTAEARRPQRGFAVGAFSERVTQKNPALKKLS